MIVKALSIVLLLTACYLCWWAVHYAQPLWYVAALVLMFCGTGLLLKRTWASYLWYAIGAAVSTVWLMTIVRLALNGWPVAERTVTVISLIPGALLLLVCAGGSLAVRRDLKQTQPQQ
jgi:hypothetical protein